MSNVWHNAKVCDDEIHTRGANNICDTILSICIPTYNRAESLGYLLNNIIEQIKSSNLTGIEICISNNCSIDTTAEVVAYYRLWYDNIVYSCNSENIGFDRNLLKAVNLASGRFCWLFGDDDRFESGSLEKVQNILHSNRGLSGVSVNYQVYSSGFFKKTSSYVCSPEYKGERFYATGTDAFDDLGVFFSFISTQIINREKWNYVLDHYDLCSCYNGFVHLYVLSYILRDYPGWLYVSEKFVGNIPSTPEWGMDFSSRLKYLRIYYAFPNAAKILYNVSERSYSKLLNMVVKVFIAEHVRQLKLKSNKNIAFLFREIRLNFGATSNFWFLVVPVIYCPKIIFAPSYYLYKVVRYPRNLLKVWNNVYCKCEFIIYKWKSRMEFLK